MALKKIVSKKPPTFCGHVRKPPPNFGDIRWKCPPKSWCCFTPFYAKITAYFAADGLWRFSLPSSSVSSSSSWIIKKQWNITLFNSFIYWPILVLRCSDAHLPNCLPICWCAHLFLMLFYNSITELSTH